MANQLEYIILREDCELALEREVVKLIAQGWQPIGGVALGVYYDTTPPACGIEIWAQALTRQKPAGTETQDAQYVANVGFDD